jgi:mRNA interferase MazF
MPKRGDIVLIPFPFSDLSGQKIRPALILSKQTKGNDVVVIFITSKNKTKDAAAIALAPSNKNGLKTASVIICDKIATLDKKIIIGSIGTLEKNIQTKVDVTLAKVLGL